MKTTKKSTVRQKTSKKPETPQLAFFAPQFYNMMIGAEYKGVHIGNADDVCRFAADCGITGINLPIGMISITRMLADTVFRDEVVEHFKKLGTPIVGLSSHTDGQLASVNDVYLDRFKQFAPQEDQDSDIIRSGYEGRAMKRIAAGLRLGALLGTTLHQTFPGGRGVPHHDQWSTLPEGFRELALLQLALEWTDNIRVAKETRQIIGFEIGHVMEGIQTVDDLRLFRSFLPKELRGSVKWGVDTSHFDKEDDNGAEAVEDAIELDLDVPGHAKGGTFRKIRGGRHRQNALPFSKQAGIFTVFGTTNPESAKAFGRVLWRDHERTETGSHGVIEGESMDKLLNPFQGMKVAAENLRRIIAGNDPIPAEEITPEPWSGKTFESFAKNDVPVSSLLQLNDFQLEMLQAAAKEHGLPIPK